MHPSGSQSCFATLSNSKLLNSAASLDTTRVIKAPLSYGSLPYYPLDGLPPPLDSPPPRHPRGTGTDCDMLADSIHLIYSKSTQVESRVTI